MKRVLVFFVILVLVTILYFLFKSSVTNKNPEFDVVVACTLDAKVCSDGTTVGRVPPSCEFSLCPGEAEGILVSSPMSDAEITNPVKIEGEARGTWFFEAQFNAELLDSDGNSLGTAILTAKGEWMTEDFVPFEGSLIFSEPSTSAGTLRFLSANPSGLPENQKSFDLTVNFSP